MNVGERVRSFGPRLWVLLILVAGTAAFLAPNTAAWAQRDAGGQQQNAATVEEINPEEDEERESRRQAERRRSRRGNVATMKVGDKSVSILYGDAPVDGPDYALLSATETGHVIQLTRAIAIKLKTDVDLQFGDTRIVKGNASKNYPGVYSLWIKKGDTGWTLVFNSLADVWGTQHDAKADVAEVPLKYASDSDEVDKLTVSIPEEGSGGELRIAWGPHAWSTSFSVAE